MMEALFSFLLKSSGLMLLFYACYHLFLKKETFFKGNRWFLLAGLLASLTLPFVTITKIIPTEYALLSSIVQVETIPDTPSDQFGGILAWDSLLVLIYGTGVLLLIIKLIFELVSFKNQISTESVSQEEGFYLVKTESQSSPFSFFKYIFYNPKKFSEKELQSILAHEKEHAVGYHSVDILFMEVTLALLWFNPIAWLYRVSLKQNLEFLADSKSHGQAEGMKFYQYLMLKQVTGELSLSLANPFYNSLIKKRIVMLNKNRSKKVRALKMLIILPLLTFFLFSFNTKNIYQPQIQHHGQQGVVGNVVDFIIDKNTSDEELEKIKKDLEKDDIDFSYTVVRNEKGEIINATLNLRGKNVDGKTFNGSYNSDSNEPIEPITVFYDDKSNFISFGNAPHKIKRLGNGDSTIWISTIKNGDSLHEITVKEDKKIIINGKELTDEELEDVDFDIDENTIIINSDDPKSYKVVVKEYETHDTGHNFTKKVTITSDSDESGHIEVNGDHYFTIVNTDDGKEPLYVIDGKIVSKKKFKKLSPEDIKSMDVIKGEKATKEYGKKAENGVIKITTKKGE